MGLRATKLKCKLLAKEESIEIIQKERKEKRGV